MVRVQMLFQSTVSLHVSAGSCRRFRTTGTGILRSSLLDTSPRPVQSKFLEQFPRATGVFVVDDDKVTDGIDDDVRRMPVA